MSESRKDLVNQRTELISMLQGDWPVDTNIKSVNRKGLRIGVAFFVAGFLFFCLIGPVLAILTVANGTFNPQISIFEFAGMMVLMMIIFGGIAYACVHIQLMWNRQFGPIVIEGAELIWAKKKGHVPERLNLETLEQTVSYKGEGQQGAGFFFKLMGRSARMFSKHMLLSPGEHNTPKITPVVFVDGDQLIQMLMDIAQINTKLLELDESSASES